MKQATGNGGKGGRLSQREGTDGEERERQYRHSKAEETPRNEPFCRQPSQGFSSGVDRTVSEELGQWGRRCDGRAARGSFGGGRRIQRQRGGGRLAGVGECSVRSGGGGSDRHTEGEEQGSDQPNSANREERAGDGHPGGRLKGSDRIGNSEAQPQKSGQRSDDPEACEQANPPQNAANATELVAKGHGGKS